MNPVFGPTKICDKMLVQALFVILLVHLSQGIDMGGANFTPTNGQVLDGAIYTNVRYFNVHAGTTVQIKGVVSVYAYGAVYVRLNGSFTVYQDCRENRWRWGWLRWRQTGNKHRSNPWKWFVKQTYHGVTGI